MRTVFVNPERCIGCRQCELACAVEHSTSRDPASAFLEEPVPRARVHVEPGPVLDTAYPNRCRHCDPAPCLQVCPTGAISRDDELGVVLVDPARCIGCAMCAIVCPFSVLTFHPLAGGPGPDVAVAVKCDGCADRLRRGDEPACAEVCKVDALVFGELNELIAAGRLRQSGAVLAAATMTRTPARVTDPLASWRAWGEELVAIEGAAQGNGRTARAGTGAAGRSPGAAGPPEGGGPP